MSTLELELLVVRCGNFCPFIISAIDQTRNKNHQTLSKSFKTHKNQPTFQESMIDPSNRNLSKITQPFKNRSTQSKSFKNQPTFQESIQASNIFQKYKNLKNQTQTIPKNSKNTGRTVNYLLFKSLSIKKIQTEF